MIFEFIIAAFLSAFTAMFDFILPEAITELPFGMSASIASMFEYVYAFQIVFWPLQPIIACVLWYIPLLVLMKTLKFFLGTRIPDVAT